MFWLAVAGGIFLAWLILVFQPGRVADQFIDPLWEKIVGPFVWILERQQ